jgi:hydrogenase nickel incorporation protein HypA/HybF
MHEAGIAASILEIAEREARRGDATAIAKVHLKLGEFTGVVREALEFAFEALKVQSRLARYAELIIESIPLSGHCPDCDWIGQPERAYHLVCPRCGMPIEILTGREMQVEAIDIEENQPCALKSTTSNASL